MWVIDKENVTEPSDGLPSRVGWRSVDFKEGTDLPYKFRMYDSDGNLYYEGRSDDKDSEDAFRPLDELGTPDAGATDIRYLENGKWESL